jgi:hypothetical protein
MCNQSEAVNNRTQWQKDKKINNHPKNTTQKTGRFSIKNADFVPRCFQPSFGSFGQGVSEEKIFQRSTNHKQEFSMRAMFVNNIRIMHRRPSIDAFNQVLVHLTKQFQRRRFLFIYIYDPLYILLISSRSVNKHGCHKQLFMVGRFLKKSSPLKLSS